jgi:hypothetical protein
VSAGEFPKWCDMAVCDCRSDGETRGVWTSYRSEVNGQCAFWDCFYENEWASVDRSSRTFGKVTVAPPDWVTQDRELTGRHHGSLWTLQKRMVG